MNPNFKQSLKKVRCFIFDIDGVLTNGSLIVMPGELHRVMNIRDGYALKEAVDKGYVVAIISGGKSESVRTRLANLGIKDIYLGAENKSEKSITSISESSSALFLDAEPKNSTLLNKIPSILQSKIKSFISFAPVSLLTIV